MDDSMNDKKYLTSAYRDRAERQSVWELLSQGEIKVEGMVPWSSNYTYLVTLKKAEREQYGIYKPQCGERPLWDFETGSLCKREVAAYELSAYLNFPNIPVTVLRDDAPQGLGMLQQFIEHKRRENFFTCVIAARRKCKKLRSLTPSSTTPIGKVGTFLRTKKATSGQLITGSPFMKNRNSAR